MDETLLTNLAAPRMQDGAAMLIAGLGQRCNPETSAGIPALWQKFVPHLGHIPGQIGKSAYGVICNSDESGNMDYICGVQVSDFAKIPQDWSRVRIPEQKYAVFAHPDHISTIRQVWSTIWNEWLPNSGWKPTGGPEFERYGEEFNSVTGNGGFEIWIPVKK